MSLDDLYNHLKVYESEVHKKTEPNSHNMAFISSAKHSSGNKDGLLTASKDLDNLIESQRSDKNKEGLGYTNVPPPPDQLYLYPNKDLSWIGLPENADDTVTDYSRPSPTVESTSEKDQNRNPSVSKNVASPITPKPFIKFVKPKDSQSETDKVFETYKNVTQEIRDQLNAEAEAVQIILTGIDNDIYSTVDACPNACEMWKVIERLKQGKSINEEAGIQLKAEQADWKDDTDDESDDQELEAHYMYMAKIQEVSPDAVDSGPIFDTESEQKQS
nr:hypothetical protein [Tanacetum cinerariifolium]